MADLTLVQPVILCGGSGTRLWPLSRAGFPKQFLSLTGKDTLFQQALARLASLTGADVTMRPALVVGNEEHRFLVSEQLREMGHAHTVQVLEPSGKNTAPAITLAALAAMDAGDDPILVVTPADQTVTDTAAFVSALRCAVTAAAQGVAVILGIAPSGPETGYGYIQATGAADTLRVLRFVEKPNQETAQGYLDAGDYYWNSGMFVLRASLWLELITKFRPGLASATQDAWRARKYDGLFIRPGVTAFSAVPAESADYAVMEHCVAAGIDLRMVPLDAGWSDLGAWDAVWQAASKDAANNATVGDVMLADCQNTLVHATSRLVSMVGVHGLVVVETPDAVLVTDRAHSQDVRKIVERLGAEARAEQLMHRKVSRPWGWYDSVDEGPRFKVKRIMVKPGASLSLQKHYHRAEHWVVVSGTAEITKGDARIVLTENQSTYIALGEIHRLTNPGTIPLEIIEVQSGPYLGEDDIVRFEDTYGRQ